VTTTSGGHTRASVRPRTSTASPHAWGCCWSGGWYDSDTRGRFELFESLVSATKGPVRVVVGPWTHGQATVELRHAGDIDFGPEAGLDSFLQLHLDWYNHLLRGADNGFAESAPLKLFVMGGGVGDRTAAGRLNHGGRWREEREWPLARTTFRPTGRRSRSPRPPISSIPRIRSRASAATFPPSATSARSQARCRAPTTPPSPSAATTCWRRAVSTSGSAPASWAAPHRTCSSTHAPTW
jgi:predicted acyl esterase